MNPPVNYPPGQLKHFATFVAIDIVKIQFYIFARLLILTLSLISACVLRRATTLFSITCENCGEDGGPTRAAFARRGVTREVLSLRDAVPERRTLGHAYARLVHADTVKGWSASLLPSSRGDRSSTRDDARIIRFLSIKKTNTTPK